MKTITSICALLLSVLCINATTVMPPDTTFRYNNRILVVSEDDEEINVTLFQKNVKGDTLESARIYEGIFTDGRSVERRYDNSFEISIPEIFKPKAKRKLARSHWSGFGIGFSNLPEGGDFGGEMASVLNLSRSLQYNLNFAEGHWRLGRSNLTTIIGMGIQFNAMHLQNNKFVEVANYKAVVSERAPGEELTRSRLHFTYLTFPLLLEANFPVGSHSSLFINGGVVAKVKTASSSKIWFSDNGKKRKTKQSGELNLRPFTFDFLVQAGVKNYGFFASYSPLGLLINEKGPKGNQGTIGLQFYF